MSERDEQRKLKIVIDTNVLVSSLFWRGAEHKLIKLVESGDLEGYISPMILEELREVLREPRFSFELGEVVEAIGYFISILTVVDPKTKLDVVHEDSADNRVLECALEAKADYVVSGDQHLLKLGEYRNIRISRAPELLKTCRRRLRKK
jgi:putative PIN family toxin of toxin-antitoxin system